MDGLLEEYAVLKVRIKKDTARMKILQRMIESELKPEQEVKKDYGTFKMVKYPKWEYSETHNEAQVALEMLEIEEREKGIATETVTYGVKFSGPKAEK